MTLVTSVHKYQITLTDGNASASASLDGQTTANCVPFITSRITTVAATADAFHNYCVEAYFSGTTVVAHTTGTDREMIVEVTVVEFAADVVQSGTYSLAVTTGTSTTDTLDPVVSLTSAFLYHTYRTGSGWDGFDSHAVRGDITATNTVTFDRDAADCAVTSGRWWTIEAQSGEFDVERFGLSHATTETDQDATIASVTMAKTAIFGSYKCSGTGDDCSRGTVDVALTTQTNVNMQRVSGSGSVDLAGFAVEFSGNENVYRDTILESVKPVSPSTDTWTGAVTIADSMVHAAGHTGNWVSGSFTGTGSVNVPDAFTAWTITGTEETTATHATGTGDTAPNDLSWEVIEWDVGAAARRVMVIS